MQSSRRAFTLVEIMVTVMILGVLFTGLYLWVQPYMMRSRDTKRVTDIQSYMKNIIMTYRTNFDTFPSNYGSGSYANLGYCLTEMVNRSDLVMDYANVSKKEGHFSALKIDTSQPPTDPSHQMTYPTLCNMTGSYIYSQIKYGVSSQLALIAARLEIKSGANYGTGVDFTDSWKVDQLIHAKKSSLPFSTPDQFFTSTVLSD